VKLITMNSVVEHESLAIFVFCAASLDRADWERSRREREAPAAQFAAPNKLLVVGSCVHAALGHASFARNPTALHTTPPPAPSFWFTQPHTTQALCLPSMLFEATLPQ
jgi:hypothetical protein